MKLNLATRNYTPTITCHSVLGNAKDATLVTFSLTEVAMQYLNKLSRKCKLRVFAAKLNDCKPSDAKFELHLRPQNHAKIWVVGTTFWVGSANLAGDSIGNLMVRVTDTYQILAIGDYITKLVKNLPLTRTHFA